MINEKKGVGLGRLAAILLIIFVIVLAALAFYRADILGFLRNISGYDEQEEELVSIDEIGEIEDLEIDVEVYEGRIVLRENSLEKQGIYIEGVTDSLNNQLYLTEGENGEILIMEKRLRFFNDNLARDRQIGTIRERKISFNIGLRIDSEELAETLIELQYYDYDSETRTFVPREGVAVREAEVE